ncbi:hypothetical protein BOTBODRAFT_36808 [Botryobasidium botryosum FD-172 SS1]|uniref:PQ-loop-domain-containing protein n=1 Tax=Botryobasidium botryosum (strain FD-172 SS1) TaxID=930990 RepID=A0A067M4R8_BOTB1|nr:hypothetical protein BOTBODRAFT_36808 [Botryobasidium botryosum FD-172 SS1]
MLAPTASDVYGNLSFFVWLGAQLFQVGTNYQRQSVEGVALPFLASWFCGDFTNLVGCILTHQLPFQRYLATYFCFIDIVLLAQYIMYSKRQKAKELQPPPAHFIRTPRSKSLSLSRSMERRVRSGSLGGSRQRRHHYRTLSDVASNVALAASDLSDLRYGAIPPTIIGSPSVVDNPLARGMEPVELESSQPLPGTSARRNVSWGPADSGLGMNTTLSPIPSIVPDLPGDPEPNPETQADDRGRSLSRSQHASSVMSDDYVRSLTLPTGRRGRSAGASRRGAGIVFLGVWALFGIGRLMGKGVGDGGWGVAGGRAVGVVLNSPYVNLDVPRPELVNVGFGLVPEANGALHTRATTDDDDDEPIPVPPPKPERPSTERIIGRIFAWTCATMYLTARLPQIWKNYVRQSVEGLSIMLFFCAAMGNAFYVASVLTSPTLDLPPPISTDYIREAVPFLIGSGGTLIFDTTIFIQSFIYRGRAPRLQGHLGVGLSRSATMEEEALLGGTGTDEDLQQQRRVMYGSARARTRSRSAARPGGSRSRV